MWWSVVWDRDGLLNCDTAIFSPLENKMTNRSWRKALQSEVPRTSRRRAKSAAAHLNPKGFSPNIRDTKSKTAAPSTHSRIGEGKRGRWPRCLGCAGPGLTTDHRGCQAGQHRPRILLVGLQPSSPLLFLTLCCWLGARMNQGAQDLLYGNILYPCTLHQPSNQLNCTSAAWPRNHQTILNCWNENATFAVQTEHFGCHYVFYFCFIFDT